MYTTQCEGAPSWRRAGILAASFLLPIGCVSDDSSPGGGTDGLDTETSGTATGDGDGDDDSTTTDMTTTGDGDGDPATTTTGDGDGDPDPTTTGETDTDTDTGMAGDCGPYPEGPYNWYDNNVVPPDSAFPAMYGPDGEEVTLTMEQVHANCKEVKALAFAFGAND